MRGKHRHQHRLPRVLAIAATVAAGATAIALPGMAGAQEETHIAGAAAAGGGGADGTIRNAGGATAVKDSYIVILNDGDAGLEAEGVEDTATEMAAEVGGAIEHRYTAAVRGFSARMTEQQATRLISDPRVAYVQQNHRFQATASQTNPPSYGLDRIDQRALPLNKAYSYATEAANVTAYIIDTGVRTTHQDFGGRATSGIDTVDNDNDATDCNGHGTHVAGTVAGTRFGVAKKAKVVGVRVLNCAGSGSDASVIAGIDWVTRNAVKPAVANLSLGGSRNDALDRAIRTSIASGVTYAVAAGNENAKACDSSPARTREAITVGATDGTDGRAPFSNFGPCVDLFAPGASIVSANDNSDTATATLSGTSMASPHVAGAAALYLATHPNATPAQVQTALVTSATTGKVADAGPGSPNRLLFTGTGNATTPPPPSGPTTPDPVTCGAFTQGTNVNIPDRGTALSPLTVKGCTGKASRTTKVDVHITHPFRGDLAVDLIAPDGSVYRLKRINSRDGSPDVHGTVTLNASAENKNGVWKLQARDTWRADTGYIDFWTITF
jgi:subtilisin family serine protease